MTSMPTANPKLMEHKIIRTGTNYWHRTCDNCMHEFKMGDERQYGKEQLYMPTST